jgi:hypothetical protein
LILPQTPFLIVSQCGDYATLRCLGVTAATQKKYGRPAKSISASRRVFVATDIDGVDLAQPICYPQLVALRKLDSRTLDLRRRQPQPMQPAPIDFCDPALNVRPGPSIPISQEVALKPLQAQFVNTIAFTPLAMRPTFFAESQRIHFASLAGRRHDCDALMFGSTGGHRRQPSGNVFWVPPSEMRAKTVSAQM